MSSRIKTITAEFEIVTPMFLGGANHEATRIRESSIKGALAFWWRALNYARFVKEATGANETAKQNAALMAMQKEEQKLFGGPDGQGAFLLKVVQPENIKIIAKSTVLKESDNGNAQTVGVGARYLGYGVINAFYTKAKKDKAKKEAGELERSCIKAGQSFTVQIMYRDTQDNLIKESLIPALKLFGLLGGLGSRVRRGWGSVALKSIHEFDDKNKKQESALCTAPEDIEKYKEAIGDLFKEHPSQSVSGTDWPLTAFASETIVRVGKYVKKNSLDVLDALGIGFMKYRAWGKPKGKAGGRLDRKENKYIGGFNVDASFVSDHDWFSNYNGQPDTPPKRSAFGLPHNYAKWLGVTAANIVRDGKTIEFDRRASPLMFHIHQTSDGNCFGVLLYMPNRFLMEEKIGIVRGTGREQTKTSVAYTFDASVISNFIENKKPDGTPPKNGDYFPSTKILPVENTP